MSSSLDLRPAGGGGGGGGAPTDATYVTLSADATLSNEAVLGTAVVMADVLAARPAASTDGRLFFATDTVAFYRDNGVTWQTIFADGSYVQVAGDTMTGELVFDRADATTVLSAKPTATTNDRVELLSDGRARFIQRDAAMPTYTGVNRPTVYIEPATQSGTAVVVRGSSDLTVGNQLLRLEDYLGAPVLWISYAGGLRITDAMAVVNGVFTITEKAGFFFRNTNGSGAILASNDPIYLNFGTSSQVWSGDPVPSGKTLGMGLGRSNWVFTGSTTNGLNTVTITAGLASGKSIPVGSVVNATGIPAATTVTATTATTITLSANATATGSVTVVCYEMDTLAIRAYNGVEIHGSDGAGATAAGKVGYDNGLILSGDNDPGGSLSGWKVQNSDKKLLPPSNNSTDIGTTSNRVRAIYAYSARLSNGVFPANGDATIDLGETTNYFRRAYVNELFGTHNDGWTRGLANWTRTSDTTFTVSGDLTARYSKGTRLKWTEAGSAKYGVVASSSHAAGTTTVTMIGTTDYVMAATPTADTCYFSHEANPEGFPDFFAYTVTHVGFSAAPTYYAYWSTIGKRIFVEYRCTANGTSNAATYTVTAPVAVTTAIASYLASAPLTFIVDNGATVAVDTMTEGTPNTIAMSASRRVYITGSTFTLASDMSTGQNWATSNGKRAIFSIEYWF